MSRKDRLPSYLLKASELPEWQARAAEQGVSFASYARDALRAYAHASKPVAADVSAPVPVVAPPKPKPPPTPPPPPAPAGRPGNVLDLGPRDVTPMFKAEKKEPRRR